MDAATLYDDDVVTWSEQQAAALRALAARPDLSNALDWENVIEEIETLGRSEWHGVESQFTNALTHIVKGYCDPDSLSRLAWSVEVREFLRQARKHYRNSMSQKIDLAAVWNDAVERALNELQPYNVLIPPRVPASCPFDLHDLLDRGFTYERGVRRLFELVDHKSQPES